MSSGRLMRMNSRKTYSRGFFFGPGFPLGLGMPSGMSEDGPLFVPGLGPGMPFRFTPFGGGASDSVFGVVPSGTGVEVESFCSTASVEGDGSTAKGGGVS